LVEAEEEFITNTLLKKLDKLKEEKTQILIEVEREEEYLTNTLHKKVEAVSNFTSFTLKLQTEKIELEKALEQEEEYIVHKLQRQLDSITQDRELQIPYHLLIFTVNWKRK
jgi:hypothetical protein